MLVKLEWLGYRMVKKLWRHLKLFSSNTGTWRPDKIAISISRVSVLTRDKNNIIVECTISSEQSVSKTLISLARLRRVKYGRFWLLSGRREIGAEIRELPENTGDLATLVLVGLWSQSKFRTLWKTNPISEMTQWDYVQLAYLNCIQCAKNTGKVKRRM